MANERKWLVVPTQLFISDGGLEGQVQVPSTSGIKVKQKVFVGSNNQDQINLEVKKVIDSTRIVLGPISKEMNKFQDLTMFIAAFNAYLRIDSQERPAIILNEINRYVYEEEPTVAIRTVMVDELGNKYSSDNPLPVEAELNVEHLEVDIQNPGLPTIENIDTDGNEQEYTFPVGTKRFSIKVRGGEARIFISYVAGATSTKYFTVEMGNIYQPGELDPTMDPLTIYFKCSKASKVIEIESWANS